MKKLIILGFIMASATNVFGEAYTDETFSVKLRTNSSGNYICKHNGYLVVFKTYRLPRETHNMVHLQSFHTSVNNKIHYKFCKDVLPEAIWNRIAAPYNELK